MSARISELTVSEFRELVADTVREALSELFEQKDPDAGLKLNPEIVELVQQQRTEYATGKQRSYTLAEVIRDLEPES